MKPIIAFITIAYGLSVALSLVVGLSRGYDSPLIGLKWLSMFVPAVAVVVVAIATHEKPLVRSQVPLIYLLLALFLIPVVNHAVVLPVMKATEGLQWQDWLTPQRDGLYHAPESRGWGVLTTSGLAAHIIRNAIVGLIVASVLSFFEEIGWRAWLLPRLASRWNARWAVIVTSVIWAGWHVPFQLSGIQHIDGVSPTRLAMDLPFGIFVAGLVIGWLWVRTESVWICTVAHGSLNSLSQYALKYLQDGTATKADLQAGAVGSLVLLGVGCVLLLRLPISTDSTSGVMAARSREDAR